MHRVKEEYRELDNQRQRKFLRSRFDGNDGPGGRAAPQGPRGGQDNSNNIGSKLASAGALSATGTMRVGDEAAERGLERIKRAQSNLNDEHGVNTGTDWATK